MARNKSLPTKLRRAKKMNQNKSIPNWIVMKTKGKVRSSPHSNRTWRNTKLKKD